jgi:ADP-ribosylglycohydrolase
LFSRFLLGESMICGVMGDYIGSIYENQAIGSFNLPLITPSSHITDESVAIAAVCDVLVGDNDLSYAESYLKWFNRYPDAGYGFGTSEFITEGNADYVGNSEGNLAASRAAPIGYLELPLSLLLDYGIEASTPTHNTEQGINGALAIIVTIHFILKGRSQGFIFTYLYENYGYLMDFYTLEQLKQTNETGSSAINSVPMAIYLGMSGKSYTETLKNILYINSDGLDTDSIMSMASSVAYAYHFGGNRKNADKDKGYKKLEFETKKYLFQNTINQPILKIIQELELSKDICGIPF